MIIKKDTFFHLVDDFGTYFDLLQANMDFNYDQVYESYHKIHDKNIISFMKYLYESGYVKYVTSRLEINY